MNLKKNLLFIFCVAFFVSFSVDAILLSEKTTGRLNDKQLSQRIKTWLKNPNMSFDFRPDNFREDIRERLYEVEEKKVADDLIAQMVLRRAVTASDRTRLIKELEAALKERDEWKKIAEGFAGKIPPAKEAEFKKVVQQWKQGKVGVGIAGQATLEDELKKYGLTLEEFKKMMSDAGITPKEEEETEEEEEEEVLVRKEVDWNEVKELLEKWNLPADEMIEKIKKMDDPSAPNFDELLKEYKFFENDDDTRWDKALELEDLFPEEEEEEDPWDKLKELLAGWGKDGEEYYITVQNLVGDGDKKNFEKNLQPQFSEKEAKEIVKLDLFEEEDEKWTKVRDILGDKFSSLFDQVKNLLKDSEGEAWQFLVKLGLDAEIATEIIEAAGFEAVVKEIEKAPDPLTQEELQNLTQAEKKASDKLFIDALREMPFAFEGAGTFEQYLNFIVDTLKDKVRSKKEFKARGQFDDTFVKTPESKFEGIKKAKKVAELSEEDKKGLFGFSMRLALQDEFKKSGAEKFLKEIYNDFIDPAKSEFLKKIRKTFLPCLFDKKTLDQLENEIMLMVVNLITGLRPAVTPDYAPTSDEVVESLFVDLRDLTGVFNLPGHAAVEEFVSILEDFKDKGFYKDVELDQIEKLMDAYQELKNNADVKKLWPEEFKKLGKVFDLLIKREDARDKLIGLVQEFEKLFKKFTTQKGDRLKKVIRDKDLEPFKIALTNLELNSEPFLKTLEKTLSEERFKNLLKKINKNIKKGSLRETDFQEVRKYSEDEKLWSIEWFVTPIEDFHNVLLRQRFDVLRKEINRLRLNPKFKRYDKLLNAKDEAAYEKLTGGQAAKQTRPFLSVLFDFDLDDPKGVSRFSSELKKISALTSIETQLLLDTDGWKELKKDKSKKFRKTVSQVLEEVLDAFRGFKLAQKGEFDSADFLEEIEKVEKVAQLTKSLISLRRKKVNQKQLEEILKDIKEGKDPAAILGKIKNLSGTTDDLPDQEKLTKLLEEKQKETAARQKIIKVIQNWIGFDPKNPYRKQLKFEPSAEKLYQEFFNEFPNLKEELDNIFKNIFRAPDMVKDWLNKKLSSIGGLENLTKKEVGSFSTSKLIPMIQPYGLLLKILSELQKRNISDKEKRQDFLSLLNNLNSALYREDDFKVFSGYIKDRQGLIRDGVYKGKLKNIIKSIKASDLVGFKDGVKAIVTEAKMGIEATQEYKDIIKGAMDFLAGEAFSLILTELKTLNEGLGFLEGDPDMNIIPDMKLKNPEGKSIVTSAQTRLHYAVINLLKGKLTEILGMITSKEALKSLDLSSDAQFVQKIIAIEDELTKEIEALSKVPRGMKDFDAQKKRVSGDMSDYLGQIPTKLEEIKKNF